MDICEHKFKSANSYIREKGLTNWDYYMVIEIHYQFLSIFETLFNETSFKNDFKYDFENNVCYIRGIKKEILDFLDLIKEEHPKFVFNSLYPGVGYFFSNSCELCKNTLCLLPDVNCLSVTDKKKKAMTSQDASDKKKKGHEEEDGFAAITGTVRKEGHGKPDVLSPCKKFRASFKGVGNKDGQKRQIFLYGPNRVGNSNTFEEISSDLKACLEVFPPTIEEYEKDEDVYRKKLHPEMVKLKETLEDDAKREYFFGQAFFDFSPISKNNEDSANALVLAEKDSSYSVFDWEDVVKVLFKNLIVCNSSTKKDYGPQKVLFIGPNPKIKGKTRITYGEIEVRNDSDDHYKELKFWVYQGLLSKLLKKHLPLKFSSSKGVNLYGNAERFKDIITKE